MCNLLILIVVFTFENRMIITPSIVMIHVCILNKILHNCIYLFHLKVIDDKAVFETCQFFVNAVLLLASWQRPYKVCLSYNYSLWSEQNT